MSIEMEMIRENGKDTNMMEEVNGNYVEKNRQKNNMREGEREIRKEQNKCLRYMSRVINNINILSMYAIKHTCNTKPLTQRQIFLFLTVWPTIRT